MALSLQDLKAQCNVVGDGDDALLTRLLAVATKQVERHLGYTLASMEGGAPADLEHAVYALAAHHFENREATLIGVTAQVLPLGVTDTIANHRRYTFGYPCEGADDE